MTPRVPGDRCAGISALHDDRNPQRYVVQWIGTATTWVLCDPCKAEMETTFEIVAASDPAPPRFRIFRDRRSVRLPWAIERRVSA